MIALMLSEIAEITGGEVVGDPTVTVRGPVVIDSREAAPGALFVAFVGEHVDGHEYAERAGAAGAVAVLGSQATALPTVVVSDVQAALQRLAATLVQRVRSAGVLTVVALTGSQGKTSTKDLLAAILSHAAPTVATRGSNNNEIGMPLTALRVDEETRFLVLEMGARGKGHIAELAALVPPDIAVVLNVGTAHLGEFGSQEAIAEAKGELVESLHAGGAAILNADDHRVMGMAARTQERIVTFGQEEPADVRVAGMALDRLSRPAFELVTPTATMPVALKLVGGHQALNAAAAAAAALVAGLSLTEIGEALAGVESLSHWRMELHELASGVIVLNDAYNANPESMRAGLDALATIGQAPEVSRTVAVLGEMKELGATAHEAHVAIGQYAAVRGIDRTVVVGEAAGGIAEGAGPGAVLLPDNAAVTTWLAENLAAGDAVLFKASNGARLFEVASALL